MLTKAVNINVFDHNHSASSLVKDCTVDKFLDVGLIALSQGQQCLCIT